MNNSDTLESLSPIEIYQTAETLQNLIDEQTFELKQLNNKLYEEINARQRIQEKLAQSESKMRAVFEAMTDVVLIIDIDNNKISNIEISPTNANCLYGHIDLVDETVEAFALNNINENWQPHLIWMDMRMPIVDGYETTQKIKATTKGQATAVIALTASILEKEKSIILSTGCDDFVCEPFRKTDIFDTLNKHLGVRYIYNSPIDLSFNHNPTIYQEAISLSDIAALPQEWLSNLKQAATCLDMERVKALITEISPTNLTLANQLIELVNDFKYEGILTFIPDNILAD